MDLNALLQIGSSNDCETGGGSTSTNSQIVSAVSNLIEYRTRNYPTNSLLGRLTQACFPPLSQVVALSPMAATTLAAAENIHHTNLATIDSRDLHQQHSAAVVNNVHSTGARTDSVLHYQNSLLEALRQHQQQQVVAAVSPFSPASPQVEAAANNESAAEGLSESLQHPLAEGLLPNSLQHPLFQHAATSTHINPEPRQQTQQSQQPQTQKHDDVEAAVVVEEGTTATVGGVSEQPSDDAMVRRHVVDAALRSKPQRGKKRDDLNASERLELTRTRNREHAKSTRNRKKARFQVLLDCEQKLLEIGKAEELDSKRRRRMMTFVDIRTTMLQSLLTNNAMPSAVSLENKIQPADPHTLGNEIPGVEEQQKLEEKEKRGGEEERLPKRCRFVSMDVFSSVEGKQLDETILIALYDCISNNEEFQFNIVGYKDEDDYLNCSPREKMRKFDESICCFVSRHFNFNQQKPHVRYSVAGKNSGLAINKNGNSFFQVDLEVVVVENHTTTASVAEGTEEEAEEQHNHHQQQQNEDEDEQEKDEEEETKENTARCRKQRQSCHIIKLLSSIVSLNFAPESDKLYSVKWCVVKDFMKTWTTVGEGGIKKFQTDSHSSP